MKMKWSIFKSELWAGQCLFSKRNLASWSPIAHAFNSEPLKIKSLESQIFGKTTGIFGYKELKEPKGFDLLTSNAIHKANILIREITSSSRKRKMVQIFDDISDTLCKVGDLAKFVISLDQKNESAIKAFVSIDNKMEEFDTNRDLYNTLKHVVDNGDIIPTDSINDYIANLFCFDFEQFGTHLDTETREEIVKCNCEIWHTALKSMDETLKNAEKEKMREKLVSARHKLAELCGFPTYAHRAIRGSIAGKPEFVHEFLTLLSDKIRNKVVESRRGRKCEVQSCDYSPYFSVGTCMDGLDYIFNSLYNVTLQIEDVEGGELWHNDVRKLGVLEGDTVLGYIYCDFFEREGKSDDNCHYTIKGGRLMDTGTYQKPVVALMLNLPKPGWARPSLLTTRMVETLFHEMGHAMHSMLGRTRYQHATGTRCSIDLAEVPSTLMEYFASDPRVVSKFARHYVTGEIIPSHLANKRQKSKNMCSASNIQEQVFCAAFDQDCHGNGFIDYSTILAHGSRYVPSAHHLVEYGAKYYAYPLSRAVASWIWHECFESDPFSSVQGRRYRNEFLAHGGSKPPRQLVENFLGAEVTQETLSNALLKDINSENIV